MGRKHTKRNIKKDSIVYIPDNKPTMSEIKEEDIPYIYTVENNKKHEKLFEKYIENEEKFRDNNEYPNFWL